MPHFYERVCVALLILCFPICNMRLFRTYFGVPNSVLYILFLCASERVYKNKRHIVTFSTFCCLFSNFFSRTYFCKTVCWMTDICLKYQQYIYFSCAVLKIRNKIYKRKKKMSIFKHLGRLFIVFPLYRL